MSNNLFVRLNFSEMKNAFLNGIIHRLNPDDIKAFQLLVDAEEDFEAFVDYVNENGNLNFGKIRLTYVKDVQTNEPKEIFISCIDDTKSVLWPKILSETLQRYWTEFWPLQVNKHKEAISKFPQDFGVTTNQLQTMADFLENSQVAASLIHFMANEKGQRSPSGEDFDTMLAMDALTIKHKGILHWLFTQQSAGFEWAKLEQKHASAQFYYMIYLQLFGVELALGYGDCDQGLKLVIFNEMLKRNGISFNDYDKFMSYIQSAQLMDSQALKIWLSEMELAGTDLGTLKKQANQLAARYWNRNQQTPKPLMKDHIFVQGAEPKTNWFSF